MKFICMDQEKEILIKRKKMKHTYFRVYDQNTLLVTTNQWMSDQKIVSLVLEKKQAIEALFLKYERQMLKTDEVLLLGDVYQVRYEIGRKKAQLGDSLTLFVLKDDDAYKERAMKKFVSDYARDYFFERMLFLREEFGFDKNPEIQVRPMKSRWGSCHVQKNKIVFNTKLIHKNQELIDYVMIHEMCHFKHPNHSRDFWNEVSKYCVNYKELRKELNG